MGSILLTLPRGYSFKMIRPM